MTSNNEGYRPQVMVQLSDSALPEAALGHGAPMLPALSQPGSPWALKLGELTQTIQQAFPGVTVRPLPWPMGDKSRLALAAKPPASWLRLGGTVDELRDHTLGLLRYIELVVPPGGDTNQLVAWLSSQPWVENAYPESGPQPPPAEPFQQIDHRDEQTYLEPAQQGGIDVQAARQKQGGRGEGIGFIDVEEGWVLNHEDLAGWNIAAPLFGLNRRQPGHGTAALGVVAARSNAFGIDGIAQGLERVGVVSFWETPTWFCKASAILHALESLQLGDVLLIEAQAEKGLPVEIEPAVFDVLQLGARWGVVVIEAAGNGQADLDTRPALNRASSAFQDSGAIVVGACDALGLPPTQSGISNYGSRIDCCAWGSHVFTTGFDDPPTPGTDLTIQYLDHFSGTSSAAAMIAGVAAVIQGMEKHRSGRPFSPQRLRDILRNPANGTLPVPDPANGNRPVGAMPDLAKIVHNLGF
jgi:serine protease